MSDDESSGDFLRAVLAWFAPPVGVFLQVGLGLAFWLNLLLTLFGWLPGAIHAAWVISSRGRESGSTTTFVSLLLCGFLPPVAVFMKRGVGVPLLVNLVLLWFVWLPGVLHATWIAVQPD